MGVTLLIPIAQGSTQGQDPTAWSGRPESAHLAAIPIFHQVLFGDTFSGSEGCIPNNCLLMWGPIAMSHSHMCLSLATCEFQLGLYPNLNVETQFLARPWGSYCHPGTSESPVMMAVSPASLWVKASVGKLTGQYPGILQTALPLVQGSGHKGVSQSDASLLEVNAQSKGMWPRQIGWVLCLHHLPFLTVGQVQSSLLQYCYPRGWEAAPQFCGPSLGFCGALWALIWETNNLGSSFISYLPPPQGPNEHNQFNMVWKWWLPVPPPTPMLFSSIHLVS